MAILETLSYTSSASVAPPWQTEQNPAVRGVVQDRITGVAGVDVPGSGTYKPTSAMRVEIRPYHNNDLTVTATADATSAATTLSMSTGDAALLYDKDFMLCNRTNEMIRISGTPSGTSVTVLRAQQNYGAAAAILTGDTFTVPCGDVNDSGGSYATSRAEVYTDLASPSSTAPALWANPPGSQRWLHWAVYVPTDYEEAPDGTNWLTTTQIKGLNGGSPPLGIEASRGSWRYGGARGNAGAFANNGILGPLNKGGWTDFIMGMKVSPDPTIGWTELWMNRQVAIPRTTVATMDYQVDGITPDPIYIKQGIYRNPAWTATHVLHFGPLTIADSSLDFGVATSPPIIAGASTGEYWGTSG